MDERDVNYLKSKIENKENQLDTYMKIRWDFWYRKGRNC